jgi:hypothetical protein
MGLSLGMKLSFFPPTDEIDDEAQETDSSDEKEIAPAMEGISELAVETEDVNPTEQVGDATEEEKGDIKDQE